MKRFIMTLVLVTIVCSLFAAGKKEAATPEQWPDGAVTVICPWAVGGVADIVNRKMATYGQEMLGQPVLATNELGATLIPLLTMGIPGDGSVALMLGALMINGLTPGPRLFTDHGVTMYAIMLGLIFVNLFMFLQGRYLTGLFAKIIKIPPVILTPIIVIFCFAGAYSVKISSFDVGITLIVAVVAYFLVKMEFSVVPILLELVLGRMTEENFRRALIISDGSWSIFASSPVCTAFLVLIAVTLFIIIRGKITETASGGKHD